MHKNVKRFGFDGIINDDSDFVRIRAEFEAVVVDDMRDNGYVPMLDLGPYWSTKLREDGKYDFIISLYGIYVGKRKAWEIAGVDVHGTLFPMTTPKDKSKQS